MQAHEDKPDPSPSVAPTELESGVSDDKEAGPPAVSPGKEDPFGDESDAQVKYKTMTWW